MQSTTPYPMAMPAAPSRVEDRAAALLPAAALVAALALSAHARVYIPFSPVPVTLQTCIVLAAGPLLGWRKATGALLAYLLLGLAGAPVFTGSAAITAGYLAGFLAAPWVVTRFVQPLAGMLAATALIYLLGGAWLVWTLGFTPLEALLAGAVPFLAGDAVKLAAAAGLVRRFAR